MSLYQKVSKEPQREGGRGKCQGPMCTREEVVIRSVALRIYCGGHQHRYAATLGAVMCVKQLNILYMGIWRLLCVGISIVMTLSQGNTTSSVRMSNYQGNIHSSERIWTTVVFPGGILSLRPCSITQAKPLKPHMDLLFASPFRPINDTVYELLTETHKA